MLLRIENLQIEIDPIFFMFYDLKKLTQKLFKCANVKFFYKQKSAVD